MKLTVEQARNLALEKGATLEIDGKVFNASRQRVVPITAPRVAPVVENLPPPMPPSAPTLTREEVEQLLDERDKFWKAELARVTDAIAAKLSASQPIKPTGWTFTPVYDKSNVLKRIDALPR